MSVNTLESIGGVPIAPKDENGVQQDNETLQMIESVCIAWFTIEYILRLAGMSLFKLHQCILIVLIYIFVSI